jgi:hypothetical protein
MWYCFKYPLEGETRVYNNSTPPTKHNIILDGYTIECKWTTLNGFEDLLVDNQAHYSITSDDAKTFSSNTLREFGRNDIINNITTNNIDGSISMTLKTTPVVDENGKITRAYRSKLYRREINGGKWQYLCDFAEPSPLGGTPPTELPSVYKNF